MPESLPLMFAFSSAMLAAAAAATAAAAVRWTNNLRGVRGCFFTFHRAAPSSIWPTLPNRDFYLDLDFLDNLLAHLIKSGRKIVTVEEGLRLAGDPAAREIFVNFSIDDCYRDTYEKVVPLFRRHGVPITLFVSTGIPDETMTLWWAVLEDTIHTRSNVIIEGRQALTDTIQRKVATYRTLQSRWDGPAINEHYSRFCAENYVDVRQAYLKHAISWEMLLELSRDPLVEIGSHTVSHSRISSLEPDQARNELANSRARLGEKLGVCVDHFAFPYGRMKDCGPRDFAIAREVGYKSVATTTKGLLRAGPAPFSYPRITLNGAHRNLFMPELHIVGASAFLARILGRA